MIQNNNFIYHTILINNQNEKLKIINLKRPKPQVRRAPPIYSNPYPFNLNTEYIIFEHQMYFHTDGSSKPNPGRSTYAWVYHQSRNLNFFNPINILNYSNYICKI